MPSGATLTNTIDLLQDKYTARFASQTHDRTKIWNMLPKAKIQFDGQQIIGLAVTGYPATGGGRGPGATLPVLGSTPMERYSILHAFCYWPIGLDWDLQDMSKGPSSWMRAYLLQMDRVRKFVSKDLERMTCSDGKGVLGTLASLGTSAGVVTLTNKYDTVNFEIGQKVECWSTSASGATLREQHGSTAYTEEQCFKVGSINPNAGTVTIVTDSGGTADLNYHASGSPTGGLDWQAGDVICKYAARTSTKTREIVGIQAAISDAALGLIIDHPVSNVATAYEGIVPGDETWWQSQIVDASSASYLSPDLIETAFTALEIFSSDPTDEIMCIWCHPNQVRKYAEEIRGEQAGSPVGGAGAVRFNVNQGAKSPWLAAGHQAATKESRYLTYAGVPIVPSRYFSHTKAFLPHRECVKRYILSDFHFVGGEAGGTIHKNYDRRAAYESEALLYGQIGTDCRNSSAQIKDLTAVT